MSLFKVFKKEFTVINAIAWLHPTELTIKVMGALSDLTLNSALSSKFSLFTLPMLFLLFLHLLVIFSLDLY